ncbi:hypothetical protein XENTR_v10012625 [Xenopus tropicalis]|nr:hypothetical protein XENTR_v10012625 [Xenopus tropicalis]
MLNSSKVTKAHVHLLSVDSINDLHGVSVDVEPQLRHNASLHCDPCLVSQPLTKGSHPGNEPTPSITASENHHQVGCNPPFYFIGCVILIIMVLTCLASLALLLYICVSMDKAMRSLSRKLDDQELTLLWLQDAISSLTKH